MLYIVDWQAELLPGSPDAEAYGRHTNGLPPEVQSRGPSNYSAPVLRERDGASRQVDQDAGTGTVQRIKAEMCAKQVVRAIATIESLQAAALDPYRSRECPGGQEPERMK
jgi:hypothetical protein